MESSTTREWFDDEAVAEDFDRRLRAEGRSMAPPPPDREAAEGMIDRLRSAGYSVAGPRPDGMPR